MVNTMISIPGYVHLYRSLLRFYDMPENEVREMLYLLNTANLDCYEYYHPDRSVIQSGPSRPPPNLPEPRNSRTTHITTSTSV